MTLSAGLSHSNIKVDSYILDCSQIAQMFSFKVMNCIRKTVCFSKLVSSRVKQCSLTRENLGRKYNFAKINKNSNLYLKIIANILNIKMY